MPTTTTLAGLLKPALRAAGITMRPGITPSPDQYNELIPEVNSMLQSWNCDGHTIFSTQIEQFGLNSGQKEYSIGPGGNFNTTRPMFIKDANLIFPTNPQVRIPLKLVDSHEWSLIQIQDISSALPWCLYYNPTYGALGRGTIYIAFQPPEGYLLELYTWKLLGAAFASVGDLVILPDGYDDAIKWNLAIRAAALYPTMATISPDVRILARQSLDRLKTLNTVCPPLMSEAEFIGQPGGWWWQGMFAGSGGGTGGGNVNWEAPLNAPNGVDTLFSFAHYPNFLAYNGLLQFEGVGFVRTGANQIRLTDINGNTITPASDDDIRGEFTTP